MDLSLLSCLKTILSRSFFLDYIIYKFYCIYFKFSFSFNRYISDIDEIEPNDYLLEIILSLYSSR